MNKKLISMLLITALLCLSFPQYSSPIFATETANANEEVAISEANFPDADFRAFLSNHLDLDKNGSFSEEEIQKITSLHNPYAAYNIRDYTGVEYFTSLTYLNIPHQELRFLPKMPASLKKIDCSFNQLKGPLDLSSCPNLVSLICHDNQLEGILDISAYPNLVEVNCKSNALTGIKLCPTANYTELIVNYNYMKSSSDVIGQTIPWNGDNFSFKVQKSLPALVVTEDNFPDPALRAHMLELSSNGDGRFTAAELKQITALSIDQMGIQDLTGVHLLTNLSTILCRNNQLTELPSFPSTLDTLYCSGNPLTEITSLPENLEDLYCDNTQLTTLPALPASLRILHCSNNQLTVLPKLPSTLTELHCNNNAITELPVLPDKITELDCSNNKIQKLDTLPNNLKTLRCGGNQLTTLPVLPVSLAAIFCEENQLQGIFDFRHNTNLGVLKCNQNEITGIILPKEPYIAINVDQNYLESKADILNTDKVDWGVWEESNDPNDIYIGEESYFGTQKESTCQYTSTIVKLPDCENPGEMKLVCSDCGEERIRLIPPTGHTPVLYKEFQPATFTEFGWHEGTICQVCKTVTKGAVEIGNVAPPKLSYTKTTYTGSIKKPTVLVKEARGLILKEGKDYTLQYASGRKNVGRYSVTITLKGNYSGKKTVYFTIVPKKPTAASAKLRTITGGYDDVRFSWNKSVGATGYLVYYKKASAKSYTFYKATTNTYVTKNNLTDGTKYNFKVVPYYKQKNSTTKYYNTTQYKSATITTLKKLNQPKVTKSGTKVKVSWNNISGETGYQISRSVKKTGTNIVKTVKTTSGKYTTVTATKGKTYYYKVRAYKLVGNTKVCGPWSTVKVFTR